MNMRLLAVTALLFVGSSSSFADSDAPDILSSISSDVTQELSDTESAEVRGEYRHCTYVTNRCGPWLMTTNKPTKANTYAPAGTYLQSYGPYFGYYVSR